MRLESDIDQAMNPLMLNARAGLFTSYYLCTGRSKVLADVERAEALFRSSRAEIDAYLRKELAGLLSHAAKTVPYYRDLLKGDEISEANAFSVLAKLPPLTKTIIRKEGSRLASETPGQRVRTNTSGGSTGEPVRLLQDLEMSRGSRTTELMMMKWAGHRRGEPHVLIWGVPQAAFGQKVPLHERVFRFVHNETYLNCYRITDALMDEWIEQLNRIQPALIEAYVDALYELSVRIIKTGARVKSPRGIIVSAGVLTPVAEEAIRKAFGAPIINRYGSREVSNVACSCGQSPELHVNETWSHLEIVDENGKPCPPGVEGNILVTLFGNRTMPLIRYRIEDRGTWATDTCPCGRHTRRLAAVNGRANDYLVAADGTRINGVAVTTYTAITSLLSADNGIRQFQYRQSKRGFVTLVAVPTQGTDREALLPKIKSAMNNLSRMFEGLTIDVKFEDEITPSNSGKMRFILNEIKE